MALWRSRVSCDPGDNHRALRATNPELPRDRVDARGPASPRPHPSKDRSRGPRDAESFTAIRVNTGSPTRPTSFTNESAVGRTQLNIIHLSIRHQTVSASRSALTHRIQPWRRARPDRRAGAADAPGLDNEMVAFGLQFGHGDKRVNSVDNAIQGHGGRILCAGIQLSGD
jgi:hypothetical protein